MILPNLDTLSSLPSKDLLAFRGNLEKAIKAAQTREKSVALAKMEAVAREAGFTMEELLSAKKTTRKSLAKAKYANPANPTQTWTGNGKRPGWLLDLLARGHQKDEFLINA